MKFAIYSRKSKFTEKGESIENQIILCKEYILNHFENINNEDISIYEDEGFSGKNLDRPQFQLMLEAANKSKFNCIVCYRLDRISRNVSDFSTLVENLNSKEVSFICIKEQFDTTTPMGRAMMYIASVFAQLERETIAERVRDNMFMLARLGRWLGGNVPLGFDSIKEEVEFEDGKSKKFFRLIVNETEINTVKLIYSKFLELKSLSSITSYLLIKDIKTKNNINFNNITIRDILKNPVYCIADIDSYTYFKENGSEICTSKENFDGEYGLISYNKRNYNTSNWKRNEKSKWIIAIGMHNGIINGSDWTEIQKMLEYNSQKYPSYFKVHNSYALLSGILKCKICGSHMRPKSRNRMDNNGNKIFDYICETKKKSNCTKCNCDNLSGIKTDKLICDELLNYTREDSFIYKSLKELKEYINNYNKSKYNSFKELETELSIKRKKISNLIITLSDGNKSEIFIKYVEEEVAILGNECKSLEKKIVDIKTNLQNISISKYNFSSITDYLGYFKENFNILSIEKKRELIRSLIHRVEWNGEELHIFIYDE